MPELKYFRDEAEARMWAATKLQSIWRSKQERERMALLRKEMADFKPFDVCNPEIRLSNYDYSEERKQYLRERRFREDAGDGLLVNLKREVKVDPSVNLGKGYKNETAGHRGKLIRGKTWMHSPYSHLFP